MAKSVSHIKPTGPEIQAVTEAPVAVVFEAAVDKSMAQSDC